MGNHNPPQNVNPNIQKVSVEPQEPNIVFITRGGVAIEEIKTRHMDNQELYRHHKIKCH